MCLFYQPLRSDCWLELLLSKGHLHFFLEILVVTVDKERNLFLFSLEHHAFFGPEFGYNHGLLLSVLTRILAH